MLFIFRWLMILVLIGLAAASLFPAVVGAIQAYNLPVNLAPVAGASGNLEQWAAATTLPERILWYAATVLFVIAAIRLIRRTQGFWMWLLGFACLGLRWVLAQLQQEGGIGGAIGQAASFESYAPSSLAAGGSSAQLAFLVVLVLFGIIILTIDAADRAYWDRQGA